MCALRPNGEGRPLIGDRAGVSATIAVILLVAITVIMAAVIGGVLYPLSTKITPAKLVAFKVEANSTAFKLTHMGGDPIDLTKVTIHVNGTRFTPASGLEDIFFTAGEYTTLEGTTLDVGSTLVMADTESRLLLLNHRIDIIKSGTV